MARPSSVPAARSLRSTTEGKSPSACSERTSDEKTVPNLPVTGSTCAASKLSEMIPMRRPVPSILNAARAAGALIAVSPLLPTWLTPLVNATPGSDEDTTAVVVYSAGPAGSASGEPSALPEMSAGAGSTASASSSAGISSGGSASGSNGQTRGRMSRFMRRACFGRTTKSRTGYASTAPGGARSFRARIQREAVCSGSALMPAH